ncbi:MAG: hypothetical protein CM1200mP20_16130 [Pseudomonadota bacterium]|nr:MAG: hypothetical protein CM1200mP20_16130 [Pseudomonadota bacterium]
MRLDYELNQLISTAGHNEYASRAIGLIQGLGRRFWFMHKEEAADLKLAVQLHAKLARSIAGVHQPTLRIPSMHCWITWKNFPGRLWTPACCRDSTMRPNRPFSK